MSSTKLAAVGLLLALLGAFTLGIEVGLRLHNYLIASGG